MTASLVGAAMGFVLCAGIPGTGEVGGPGPFWAAVVPTTLGECGIDGDVTVFFPLFAAVLIRFADKIVVFLRVATLGKADIGFFAVVGACGL